MIQLQKIRDGAISQHTRKKQVAKRLAPFQITLQDEHRSVGWTGVPSPTTPTMSMHFRRMNSQ